MSDSTRQKLARIYNSCSTRQWRKHDANFEVSIFYLLLFDTTPLGTWWKFLKASSFPISSSQANYSSVNGLLPLIISVICWGQGIILCQTSFLAWRSYRRHDLPQQLPWVFFAPWLNFCVFKSRVPTQLELDTLPWIITSSDDLWHLSRACSNIISTRREEEEAHTQLVSSIKINQETINCDLSKDKRNPTTWSLTSYWSAFNRR